MENKELAKIIAYRILIGLACFFFIIHGFWIVALFAGAYAFWKFPFYFELILFGLMYDSLFGHFDHSIYSYAGIVTSLVVAIVLISARSVVRKGK
jgi:hypothetical protein